MTTKERILERLRKQHERYVERSDRLWRHPCEASRTSKAIAISYGLAIEIVEAEFEKEGEDEKQG
jgi:hypothetical protein